MQFAKTLTTTVAFVALALSGCVSEGTGGADQMEIYGEAGRAANGDLIGTLNPGFIQQAGSSTVLPIAQAWADDFGATRGVQVKVAGGGSGAGGKGICRGELDIGDQSRPMKQSEFDLCADNGVSPVAWTVAFDGLSVVVSKSNDFADDLTVEQLKEVFVAGGASTWKDVDSSFPDEPIQRCAPDAESGTWDYFDEVIMDGAPLHPSAERSADDNALVSCTAGSDYAIGFFGFAYLKANEDKIKAVKVESVAPTFATIADGSYTPLARPIFMVTDGVPAAGSILHDYFAYAFHLQGGQSLVEVVGYVSLDEQTRQSMVDQLEG